MIGAIVAIAVFAVILFVAGFLGPAIAAAGFVLALFVLVDPAGRGRRVRRFLGWRHLPGMTAASAGALPFAALLVAYAVPVPMGAFVLSLPPPPDLVATTSYVPPAPSSAAIGLLPQGTPPDSATVPPVPTPPAPPSPSPSSMPPPVFPPSFTALPGSTFPPVPSATPSPSPSPTQATLCGAPANPWSYNFCGGVAVVSAPSGFCQYFACVASFWSDVGKGAVVECRDTRYSHGPFCTAHGGVMRALDV